MRYDGLSHLIRADGKNLPHFRISYTDPVGVHRTYLPDYYDSLTETLYEIKISGYKSYHHSGSGSSYGTSEKEAAAVRFCDEHGWVYKVIEVDGLTKDAVFEMRRKGDLTLTAKWEKQYQAINALSSSPPKLP